MLTAKDDKFDLWIGNRLDCSYGSIDPWQHVYLSAFLPGSKIQPLGFLVWWAVLSSKVTWEPCIVVYFE